MGLLARAVDTASRETRARRDDGHREKRPSSSLDAVFTQRELLKNGGDYGSIARARREARAPLARDVNTRDHWVSRHPEVVPVATGDARRAAGRALEPTTTRLMACGAVTPAEVHFVHNLGAVPRCAWETHALTVEVDDARGRR